MESSRETPFASSGVLLGFLVAARTPLLVVFHFAVFCVVLWFAFLMRFTMDVPEKYTGLFSQSVLLVATTKVAVFFFLGSFHGWWRYVHFSDLVCLFKSAVVSSLAVVAVDYLSTWRIWEERVVPLQQKQRKKALVVGSGFASSRLVHLINGQRELNTRVIGLVSPSDEPRRSGFVGDIRVLGDTSEVARLMDIHEAEILFVVSGALKAKGLRSLLDLASENEFEIKILQKLEQQLQGLDKVPIREVSYDDLLRRESADLDLGAIKNLIAGKSVMVTGAGGSIVRRFFEVIVQVLCSTLLPTSMFR